MAGTPYTLQANKKTTVSGAFAAGATSLTLASAVFTNFTDGYLVIDYDVDAKLEVIKCTVSGTAVTAITRGQDGTSDVAHSSGAKIGFMFLPGHYEGLKAKIGTSTVGSGPTANSATFVSTANSQVVTTTGGTLQVYGEVVVRHDNASAFYIYRVKRDSTVIYTSPILGGGAANMRVQGSILLQDSPAAGTYTYNMEFNSPSAGTTYLEEARLLVTELAT